MKRWKEGMKRNKQRRLKQVNQDEKGDEMEKDEDGKEDDQELNEEDRCVDVGVSREKHHSIFDTLLIICVLISPVWRPVSIFF